MTLFVARDEHGCPRAVAAAVIDEAVCLIEWATSNSHEARWALHDHLVEVLITRGVKYLLASGEGPFGALGFTGNVQNYQRLLCYELRHLRLAPAPAATSGGQWDQAGTRELTTPDNSHDAVVRGRAPQPRERVLS